MDPNNSLKDVGARFLAMSEAQRQLFLVTYMHEITVLARMRFEEGDFEAARLCNETIHRAAAHMASSLRRQPWVVETSFIEMVVADAAQKGSQEILLRSVEMSA